MTALRRRLPPRLSRQRVGLPPSPEAAGVAGLDQDGGRGAGGDAAQLGEGRAGCGEFAFEAFGVVPVLSIEGGDALGVVLEDLETGACGRLEVGVAGSVSAV